MQPSIHINYYPNGQSEGMLLYGEERFSVTLSIKIWKEKSRFVIEYLDDSDTGKMLLPLIEKNVLPIREEYKRLAAEYQEKDAGSESPVPAKKWGEWGDIKTTHNTSPRRDSRNLIKVCVDEKGPHIEGRIYTMYSKRPVAFSSLQKMLLWIDNFLDFLSYPMAAFKTIGFKDKKERVSGRGLKEMPKFELSNETGKKATFIIKILHRQNASWQGTITWCEEKKQRQFHSTLEMIRLIDSVTEGYDTDIIGDLDLSDEPENDYAVPDESEFEVVLGSINKKNLQNRGIS